MNQATTSITPRGPAWPPRENEHDDPRYRLSRPRANRPGILRRTEHRRREPERLKFMKDSVRNYELTLGGDRATVLTLQEKPVFRLGKQYGTDVEEGAIFLWTGEYGRPEAAIQVFQIKSAQEAQGLWIHEFTSFANDPHSRAERANLVGTTKPGLEFKPLAGAPSRPSR